MDKNTPRARVINLFYKYKHKKIIDKEVNLLIDKLEKYLLDYYGSDTIAEKIGNAQKNTKSSAGESYN